MLNSHFKTQRYFNVLKTFRLNFKPTRYSGATQVQVQPHSVTDSQCIHRTLTQEMKKLKSKGNKRLKSENCFLGSARTHSPWTSGTDGTTWFLFRVGRHGGHREWRFRREQLARRPRLHLRLRGGAPEAVHQGREAEAHLGPAGSPGSARPNGSGPGRATWSPGPEGPTRAAGRTGAGRTDRP